MAYVPNNLSIFAAAYSGALAGMGASGRLPSDPNSADYAGLASTAGFFAEAYDTVWGVRVTHSLDVQNTQQLCMGAWQERSVLSLALFLAPGVYTPLATALVAMVVAGEGFFTSQGISPDIPGGPVVLAGDATGPSGANSVVALRGSPIANVPPVVGDPLVWNGAAYAPAAVGGALAGDTTGPLGANLNVAFHGPGAGAPFSGFVNIAIDNGVLNWTLSQNARTDASAGQDMFYKSQGAAVGNGAAGGQLHIQLGYSDSALNGARKIFFEQDQVPGGGALTSLAFIDNVGRMQIAGGPTSASTTIGAGNASTAFGGVSFAVPAPANVTSTNYGVTGNNVDIIVNAPNQTIVATAAIRFRILGNFDGDYMRLTYETGGNGKFALQSNAGTGPTWYDWRMPGTNAITSLNEHYVDQGAGIETTNATVTAIRDIPIPPDTGNGQVCVVEALFVSQAETVPAGGLVGDTAVRRLAATFKNKGGVFTQVGATTTIFAHVDGSMAGTVAEIVLSGSNARCRFTGLAGTTIDTQLHPIDVTVK